MSRPMTHDEWQTFVQAGTHTGKLAVARKDGAPHVVPIWFVLDGDDFVFTTNESTVKGKSLQRDGRAALCVDDEKPPFAFVSVEGRARTSTDLEEMRVWTTKIGARYMGEDRAEEFGRRNAVEGELLVRLTPDRVVAIDDMTG
jgi:PPOX class probable F420-dependent enzyme